MKKTIDFNNFNCVIIWSCSNQNEVSQNETEKPVGFVQKRRKAKKNAMNKEKGEKRKGKGRTRTKRKEERERKRLKQNNLRIKRKLLYKH